MNARKQTSSRISGAAASLLAKLRNVSPWEMIVRSDNTRRTVSRAYLPLCTVGKLRSILGSALGQDETPGQRVAKVRSPRVKRKGGRAMR
jgi:hypothetical protein